MENLNFEEWFEKYRVLGVRFDTFKLALLQFLLRGHKYIIETGGVRHSDISNFADGKSTYVFSEICSVYNKELWSVDINPNVTALCEGISNLFYPSRVHCVTMDSLQFLKDFYINNNASEVGLLYLDSYDCNPYGDTGDAQIHQLNEFKAIADYLPDDVVVMMDDNDFANGGKTKLLKEYFTSNHWINLADTKQTIWIKK